MALRDVLTLTTVQVAREVYTTDGMGGGSTSTTLTTLDRAAIWMAGSGNQFLSDKVAKASSHVLAVGTDSYTWVSTDAKVVHGSNVYRVVGNSDDVMNLGELTIVGLERLV